MEIIRIGENKLKLILTDEDLEKHHLKFETLNYDNTETRRILWQILDEAKQKTGFDAAAEKTLVQAYPGRKSGCEIYVTRLNARTSSVRGRHSVFRFEDASELFTVCYELSRRGRHYEAALYEDEKEHYYLCIKEPPVSSIQKDELLSPLSFIEEYGQKLKGNTFFSYIKEHGACLIDAGAIEALCHFNCEVKV